MNEQIRQLQPNALWNHFADINAIPRASKKEQKIVEFLKLFGENLKLPTIVDEVGNVIIKKKASNGMENRQTVVLQSHVDMVHQKNSETIFDFETQGIEMFVENDWVRAKGTTLGADNGIGVAAIMSILQSTDIEHPPIEALFTIDEETGMTGALSLKGGLLDGKILLNLDTEADNELTIGCAGGIDVTVKGKYIIQETKFDCAYRIIVKGLTGGHSGAEIHLGRANANKLMNRILYKLSKCIEIGVSEIDGGSLRNAIPRESKATLLFVKPNEQIFKTTLTKLTEIITKEYEVTDPNLSIIVEETECPSGIINESFLKNIFRTIYTIPNGIYRMSPEINGLVQSSNNLARVLIKNGNYEIQCLTRSSVDNEKEDLATTITEAFEILQQNANIILSGSYPGWRPKPDAPIIQLMTNIYHELFRGSPNINAVHAGLECGILGTNYPETQMISFGPNIVGPHSPDEKVQISSVLKFWDYLLEVLKNIPAN